MQAEHPENNPAPISYPSAPKILKSLTVILLVMTPVGFLIMFTEFGKEYLWTTTIFLGLQALITFIVLIHLADKVSVIIVTSIILIASYLIEWWGTNTGFPFGLYSYTNILRPLVNGVPLAISFAWFVVAANSLMAVKYFLGSSSGLSVVIVSSVLVLATDFLLEPFASFVNNFWLWQSGSIPLQNFASWLIIGLIFAFALNRLVKWRNDFDKQRKVLKIPLMIICINVLNFSAVNIVSGYYVLTLVGLLSFGVMMFVTINSGKISDAK